MAFLFAAGKTSTTGLVETMTQTGGSFTYEYDDNGNITRVVQDGVETAYTYDALGQLTQVDDGHEGATWEYTYDQGGNIKSKKKVVNGVETESMAFEYTNANWRDQLTKVNDKTITYDQIGNPLNDGTWQYEWVNGRQLARIYSVDTDASFVYNENGLRVQKTVNGVVTKYTLHGKDIKHMTQGSNELHFFYDTQNKPAIVVFNGVPYSYVKNLQGDIVAILDANGVVVVSYVYDAWGRPISKTGSMAGTLGTVQPFRYRDYVYDEETGLYYLRSRYYDSNVCRFLRPDVLYNGNLFCYCADSPVIFHDASGKVLQCCLDDNGMQCTFSTIVMGGGLSGGSFALPGMNRDDSKTPDLTDRLIALQIYNHYTKIVPPSEAGSSVSVGIEFEKWLQTNDRSKWTVGVSDWLAYYVSIDLRKNYGIEYVDLTQTSAEFHGHALADVITRFFNGSDDVVNQSTDVFDIDVYQDGRVIDPKWWRQLIFEAVDFFTFKFYAD